MGSRLFGLSSWWRRRQGGSLEHLHFLFYTRQNCHLCEVAWRQVQAAQRQHRFILEILDVDAKPELTARYGDLVPVVTVNGKVRFRGAVNPVLLDRLLRAEKEKVTRGLRRPGSSSSP
jgi:hypothetical protein